MGLLFIINTSLQCAQVEISCQVVMTPWWWCHNALTRYPAGFAWRVLVSVLTFVCYVFACGQTVIRLATLAARDHSLGRSFITCKILLFSPIIRDVTHNLPALLPSTHGRKSQTRTASLETRDWGNNKYNFVNNFAGAVNSSWTFLAQKMFFGNVFRYVDT